MAMSYGHVYVASVAFGAKMNQTVQAFLEADAYPGPSLIIAYSHCIAHGYDMRFGAQQQKLAVSSGVWPLYRYDPRHAQAGEHPFKLDSRAPKLPVSEFMSREARFAMLQRARPDDAAALGALAQHDVDERWHVYEQMAEIEHEPAAPETAEETTT